MIESIIPVALGSGVLSAVVSAWAARRNALTADAAQLRGIIAKWSQEDRARYTDLLERLEHKDAEILRLQTLLAGGGGVSSSAPVAGEQSNSQDTK